ncbi:hypothetical protein [Virgibacillus salexigens]|uniref:hypothetical protein n=1 Tax=Virgibacillus salexigens TaxID=61016 RepID=UPI00190A0E7F|nr:hypothetical protein [Virgibacillus salexigens]
MSNKLIPFYTEYKNTDQNHTLFLDHKSNRVYKAYHQRSNNLIYILMFVLVLAVLRAIQYFQLPVGNPILLLIVGFLISIFIGIYSYKKFTYEAFQEIFITQNTIDNYIQRGKKVLKTELWVVIIIGFFQ